MRVWLATAAAIVVSATAANAQFDTTPLFARGAWVVDHVYNETDGSSWCEATTTNRHEQKFDITAYDSGHAALYIFDHRWSLSPRRVRFSVDIDYSRWTIDGSADGTGVSVSFSDGATASQFLHELGSGQAVAVYNDSEVRLGTFSLSGSRAALQMLAECWTRILPSDSLQEAYDPFTRASDPF